jgi:hypothetical protein
VHGISTTFSDIVDVFLFFLFFFRLKLDIWIFGYLDIWIFEYLDIWIFGYLDIWIFGYLDIWIFGYLDIWIFYTFYQSSKKYLPAMKLVFLSRKF